MKIIYKIENLKNKKVYIGKDSHGPETRWNAHKRLLERNVHTNSHFQHSWNKYGPNVWDYSILETVFAEKHLNDREIYYIKFYKSINSNKGYNKTTGGEENYLSEESRKKLSENNSRYWKGQKFSKEHCLKISESKKLKYFNGETVAWNKGLPHTKEHKKNLSKNHANFSGKNHPFFGKVHSEESMMKMGIKKRKTKLQNLIDPKGKEWEINTSVNKFCKVHKLVPSCVSLLFKGTITQHKGWKCC